MLKNIFILAAMLCYFSNYTTAQQTNFNLKCTINSNNTNPQDTEPVNLLTIDYNSPTWAIIFHRTSGAKILRSEQYYMRDISKGQSAGWEGLHIKRNNLRITGLVKQNGSSYFYSEWIIDLNKSNIETSSETYPCELTSASLNRNIPQMPQPVFQSKGPNIPLPASTTSLPVNSFGYPDTAYIKIISDLSCALILAASSDVGYLKQNIEKFVPREEWGSPEYIALGKKLASCNVTDRDTLNVIGNFNRYFPNAKSIDQKRVDIYKRAILATELKKNKTNVKLWKKNALNKHA